MNINTTSLKAVKHEYTVELRLENGEGDKSSVYLLFSELTQALEHGRAVCDDCGQFMVLANNGARVVKTDRYINGRVGNHDGHFLESWYTFPLDELGASLYTLMSSDDNASVDFSPMLSSWADKYGPKVDQAILELQKHKAKLGGNTDIYTLGEDHYLLEDTAFVVGKMDPFSGITPDPLPNNDMPRVLIILA